jgi:hypothetical protein
MYMDSTAPLSDESLVEDGVPFEIPVWFRWISGILALGLIVPPTIFIVRYSVAPAQYVSPANLGVVQLILAGTLILLFALAPWRALGLRIRKVGFVEFDRVLSGQANENTLEFTELRTRIEELDTKMRGLDDVTPISEHLEDLELYPLLSKLLNENSATALSPLRIREWGSRQPGYEKLAHANLASIRRILQKLVAEGRAATRVSRLGNTLYKAAD